MPLIDKNSPLPLHPKKILVCGTSGSGKTTLARQIGAALSITTTEIDALFHGPNWTPRATFVSDIASLTKTHSWVIEWQYASVRSLLLDNTDFIVWLDLPHLVVLWQIIVRTVHRRLKHQKLWNGNIEPPLWTMFTNPEHVIRWSWSTRHLSEELIHLALDKRPLLPIVRLRSHRSATRWITDQLSSPRA